MSLHSYSRVWLHLIWGTLERRPLITKPAAPKISEYLSRYSREKGFYMKINFVNAEHVHALIDLPTGVSIEQLVQLFKGGSSHWINQSDLLKSKFCVGPRVRSFFGFSFGSRGGSKIYRQPGRSSSEEKLFGRIAPIC